jgi:uncharacterized membrane protein (UPF0127 family)
MKLNNNLILLLLFVIIASYFLLSNLKSEVKINNGIFSAEVAIFNKEKGLGLRSEIKEDQGMLFVFLNNNTKYFWMKDMQFPLDFIWINGNRIVNVTENVPVYTNGEFTKINSMADKVLELKAGSVSKYRIKVGDKIAIKYKF